MASEPNIFDSYIVKSILAKNDFNITGVNELESVKSVVFDFKEYAEAEKLIMAGRIELIQECPINKDFREYLEIMRFTDQNDNQYIVTVYDSDELWQDPEVIKVFLSGNILP